MLERMDIVVTRTHSPVSWWIRKKTNSDWSHACLIGAADPKTGQPTLFTTTAWGYKQVDAAKYLNGKTYAVYRLPSMDADRIDMGVFFNRKILNTPYAWRDIFHAWLQNWKGRAIKKLAKNSKNYYCAEAVAETYKQMGYRLLPHRKMEPSGFMPHHCAEDVRLKLITTNDNTLR